MRATVMYGPGGVRMENVSDARLIEPTGAMVRVTRAAIRGGDPWPYKLMEPGEAMCRMGQEAIGVAGAVRPDVHNVWAGQASAVMRKRKVL